MEYLGILRSAPLLSPDEPGSRDLVLLQLIFHKSDTQSKVPPPGPEVMRKLPGKAAPTRLNHQEHRASTSA